jgi:DNA ligase (NAD+)
VIPYVIGPITELRTGNESKYVPPKQCPTCKQPVEHIEGEVAWYCVNAACPAQLIRTLEHFASRGAMDINGLGIKIVEQLVGSNMVKDLADIYSLTKDDLLKLEGFAEKKAENLLAGIESSKSQPLSRVINALGIRGVGEVMAGELARNFSDLGKLSRATLSDLYEIEGIGPNIAMAIVDWFGREPNIRILSKLHKAGIWPEEKISNKIEQQKHQLSGLTFVITGTIEGFSREDLKNIIQQNGGKTTDSVSKNTDYVLVGDQPGSKFTKAQQLGVKIINIDQFNKILEG